MLDAYSIRKAVPRILLAVIAINLSIYLCVAALDITTVVSKSLADLIVAPFTTAGTVDVEGTKIPANSTNTLVGGGALAVIFLAIITIVANPLGVIGLLLPLIITIVIIAVAVLFTLVIRQGLLLFLIVVSPVAMAAYILPGTEKYFKKWGDLFVKTLMVYPIVMAVFAVSNALGAILLSDASGAGAASFYMNPANIFTSPLFTQFAAADAIKTVKYILAIFLIYAPLFLIPFSFKLAGGALGAVMGAASGGIKKANLGGRAGQKFGAARKNPDGFVGGMESKLKDKRIQSGLTGRQLSARAIPSRHRADRMRTARELDQKHFTAQSQEAFKYKAYAQDSDVMQSMVMTNQEVSDSRRSLAQQRSATQADLASGNITQSDYEGKMRAINRQDTAHAIADRIGRTSGNQRAAFLNADRIKYETPEGKEGYTQDLARAQRIFENDSSTGEAMNAWQGIASGPAGRTDLTGGLYGQTFDTARVAEKNSAGQILSGHYKGVQGMIDTQLRVLNDEESSGKKNADGTAVREEYSLKQKEAAIQNLTSLQAAASSAFGAGSEGNKALVKKQGGKMEEAYKKFAGDRNMQVQSQLGATSQTTTPTLGLYSGKERVARPEPGTVSTVNPHTGEVEHNLVMPTELAARRINDMAGIRSQSASPNDPAAIAAQQEQAKQAQQEPKEGQ